jgi:hypothetical protein
MVNEHTPRFSLRNLFLAMTLIATVVAMGFNYPAVTFFVLLFLSPFVFVAFMASLAAVAVVGLLIFVAVARRG